MDTQRARELLGHVGRAAIMAYTRVGEHEVVTFDDGPGVFGDGMRYWVYVFCRGEFLDQRLHDTAEAALARHMCMVGTLHDD